MQEEGMQEEVERLKKDKNILMQELIVLRQRLQISDHELQTLVQRLKGMEQRQKQMMSFMSKAMQSPVFIKQFVNPNDNSDRRIITVNKKRRLPSQENKLETENTSPEGQIIKYQPLMTEAATSMLRQIMKLGTPQRMEPFGNENFFIDNFNSVGAADNGSNSSRNLGVTLSVVPTSPGISQLSVNSGFPEICSSVLAENQSPAGLDGMSMLSPDGINIPEFPHMSGIVFSNSQVGVSRDGPVPDMGGVYEGLGVSRNGPVPDMGDVYEVPGGVPMNGPAPDMGGVYEGPRVPRNGLVPDMGGVYEGPGVRRNGPVPDMGGVYEGSGVPDMGGVYEGPGVPRNGPVPDMGGLYGGPVPGVGDGLLGVGDGLLLVDSEGFALDSNIDLSVDDGEQLPSINDAFWEQFLTSPLPGDAEEAESGTELPEIDNDWQGLEAQGEQSQPEMETQGKQLEMEDDWHNGQNMDSLTEQMGLLASERRM